eukprot:3000708-Rhodomonas_salina.3
MAFMPDQVKPETKYEGGMFYGHHIRNARPGTNPRRAGCSVLARRVWMRRTDTHHLMLPAQAHSNSPHVSAGILNALRSDAAQQGPPAW